jgi:hypothetical protein
MLGVHPHVSRSLRSPMGIVAGQSLWGSREMLCAAAVDCCQEVLLLVALHSCTLSSLPSSRPAAFYSWDMYAVQPILCTTALAAYSVWLAICVMLWRCKQRSNCCSHFACKFVQRLISTGGGNASTILRVLTTAPGLRQRSFVATVLHCCSCAYCCKSGATPERTKQNALCIQLVHIIRALMTALQCVPSLH